MTPDRQGIDWEAVRRRLEASQLALERALTTTPERLEAVYRERATALANRQGQVTPVGRRVLVFELGQERYGLDFGDVAGIIPFDACTPVPGAPPELLGVMNIAGDIRSVIDLRRMLGLSTPGAENGYVLLVINAKRGTCLRVDAIDRVRLVLPSEVAAPDEATAVPLVDGMTTDRVKLLKSTTLLDQLALPERAVQIPGTAGQ